MKFIIFSAIAVFFAFFHNPALAQTATPELIVTWQAQNYQPADYKGKNLATLGSPIIAAVELIDNGKLIDLSKTVITWFQNGEVIVNGAGTKRIAFNLNGLIGDRVLLEADVDYEKKSPDGKKITIPLQGTAIIPVAEPKTVIAAPHVFNQAIRAGVHNFKALPFFFNIKSLKELVFSWSVNEQQEASAQNPDVLNLEITSENPDPVPINLKAAISNINNIIETAKDEMRLILIP